MPLLDHVGIRVTDLDRAARFYKEVFGFEEIERRRLGRDVDSVALRVGANLIFLLHRSDFKTHDPKAVSGVDHVAFSFDPAEWEQVTKRTKEMGVHILRELPSVQGSTGWGPSQYIHDPDRNEIEIKSVRPLEHRGTETKAL
jgi:catechol 2,3-dioxygenase-like lactoylglutathione lyase family enzyme